jgi:cobalt-zinc-cadmium resistance protein CzcA
LTHLRSVSLAGLSVITIIYDDDIPTFTAREEVLDRLAQATTPPGVNPGLGPDYSPTGQIMFYTLQSTNPQYDTMELKALQDWFVLNQLKSVPNVVDVNIFGGPTREYQVQVDSGKLVSFGLSLSQVEQALINNNTNAGGGFIQRGQQALNVRAVGLMQTTDDIATTVVKVSNGTPVRVRDLGAVVQAPKVRLGQLGKAIRHEDGTVINNDDVVEGIVLLRKGAEAQATLAALHEKIEQLNNGLLPPGVQFVPHLDRSDLVKYTSHTVLRNLTHGVLLVVLVLVLFLGNVRSALVVAITIPFSLLFASILLDLNHIPANLLSLGALDFGMIVDGAVVMVENTLRHIESHVDPHRTLTQVIGDAAHEVQRPVFFAILVIITAYLPIFTLQRVEGRLFHPMAWRVSFALLGALIFSLLVAPVLSGFLFQGKVKEWRNPVFEWVLGRYQRGLEFCLDHLKGTMGAGIVLLIAMLVVGFGGFIGSEFLPHLDEGAIWVRGTLAPSTGPDVGIDLAKKVRLIIAGYPEVTQVVSQVGRPDDGSDASGFYNTEFFVDLLPREKWRREYRTKDELIAAMDESLSKLPGVIWNFSQPISDNVEEAVSGVKGELAVKLFGRDLKTLEQKAEEMQSVMSQIPGIADLGTFEVRGQPNVNLLVDRAAADRFGINVTDKDAVEGAVGGMAVSQILIGEQRFDLTVRYQPQYRETVEDIGNIRVLAPSGERVALSQVTHISLDDGASTIYREGNSRYIAIKYSVRGRDLGSTVRQAIDEIARKVSFPQGYHLDWTGEYESQQRANRRLAVIVPITLLLMAFILYSAFTSWKWVLLILAVVSLSPMGGFLSLLITGTHFSVSSGLGFLALIGVSVQTGVIMVEYINQLRVRGRTVRQAAEEGASLRLRPIIDDDAGGHARTIACGHVARYWLGLATAVCDCHRGRSHV